jgi:hypothetical protein
MSFWVVKYDVMGFAKDADYHDIEVESPFFIRPSFNTRAEAEEKAKELNGSAGGDIIEADLKNDKHYKGKRYVYSIAEDSMPAEEMPYGTAEETGIRRADDGVHTERATEHSQEPRP